MRARAARREGAARSDSDAALRGRNQWLAIDEQFSADCCNHCVRPRLDEGRHRSGGNMNADAV